ncbi:MAG: aspartyl-phosphate phosphatase Spo0E family protein [Clostridia bacterium]|nr:aspartyl-phosphate phosphatase Spo0E family protein [Clostridia bacterium]
MCSSPLDNVALCRRRLEAALLRPSATPEELLAMSQQLDRLINHMMRVRSGRFARALIRGVRRRRSDASPRADMPDITRALP